MENFEKVPSLEDYKIAEMIDIASSNFFKARQETILEDLEPYGQLNQGIEFFLSDLSDSSKEITKIKDLDKISVDSVLKGYIGARFVEDIDLIEAYIPALVRKGITEIDFLDKIIEVSEKGQGDISVENIKSQYYRGVGD